MKKIIYACLLIFVLSSCASTGKIPLINNQDEDGGARVFGLSPMVAPSENQQAMSYYNLGTRLLHENKLGEAEKYLRQAIELDPLFVDAMDHLGLVYRRQNRLAEAEEMYLKSISLNKENKVPYQNLAVIYKMQNRFDEAFRLYVVLVDLDQNDPEGYYGIGEIFYTLADYENAILFFDKALEIYINLKSPYIYDVYFYKGMMYFGMGEYDEALWFLEEAQKSYPNNSTIQSAINEIRSRKA